MGLWWGGGGSGGGAGARIDRDLIPEKVETYIQKSDEDLHLA